MLAGEIVELWRYPVKSMMGERLQRARITTDGIPGDRGFAVADAETGRVISAKRMQTLLLARAVSTDGVPRVELPNGVRVAADEADAAISEWLGRAVRVVRAAEGRTEIESEEDSTFNSPAGALFDAAPLHIITTSTLAHMRTLYPEGVIDARRFRPNIVVRTPDNKAGPVEQNWIGSTLEIGDVRLELAAPCTRCVMTTSEQDDLPRDKGVLRTVARELENIIGVYAFARATGEIAIGDRAVRAERS